MMDVQVRVLPDPVRTERTSPYRFVWAMGGENQAFDDMDPVGMDELR